MKSKAIILLAFILALVSSASAVPLVGLTSQNQLITFNSDNPALIISSVEVSGLQAGETIVAIDLNATTKDLLGISSLNRLFSLDPLTGAATLVEEAPLAGKTLGDSPVFEVDPVLGALRILDSTGLNAILSPVTGILDQLLGILLYPLGDVNFLKQPEIIEGAFDNLRLNGDAGILYLIDKKTGSLVEVGSGLLTTLKTIAPISGVSDISDIIGFEIPGNGLGIIGSVLDGGITELRLLNLLDGTTTLLGTLVGQLLDLTSLPETTADTLIVTNTNNDGPGSLRAAVAAANLSVGRDEIKFDIPGNGPHQIKVSGTPISIIGSVDILGSTQPGFSGSPVITLVADPTNAPDELLDVVITLAGANISDLRFEGAAGMDSLLSLNTLGSVVANCEFNGNGNPVDGITVGGLALNNTITNCSITGCENGLFQSLIGASTTITDCFVSENNIGLHFALNVGLQVLANTASISGCTITENAGAGVRNSGGIVSRVLVRENSIYDNGGLGIDNFTAGVTENNNDLLDDLGVLGDLLGGSINYPVITSAAWEGAGLRIQGTVDTFTLMNLNVDFYLSPSADPSGHGEGRTFIGTANVDTDLLGAGTFDVLLPVAPKKTPQYLSATSSTNGVNIILLIPVGAGTSEFSSTVLVPGATDFDSGMDLPWNPSGMDSGPEFPFEPDSPNDVDLSRTDDALSVIVRPSTGRLRNAGWIADTGMTTSDVGPNNIVRGKFYVHASNPESAPLNTVPNFRIRLQNEAALLSAFYFDYAGTGLGGTPHEDYYDSTNNPLAEATAGESLRPSPDPLKPSLYRVDFDPIEVPAAQGTKILALFESFSANNPADGTLSLVEFSMATYPKPDNETQIFGWSNVPALDATNGIGGMKSTTSGSFNTENVFRVGRRPALDLPGEVAQNQLPTITDTGNAGVILDTAGVAADRTGIALWDVFSSTPTESPRIEPNKVYRGRFLLSSDMPTSPEGDAPMQGDVYLSLKTGFGSAVARTEIIGTNHFVAPIQPSADIASQILPGVGNQVADPAPSGVVPQGEVGAWYNVVMSSPLSADIRQYANGDLGTLGDQPGPSINTVSARDIGANVSVLQLAREVELGPDMFMPFATANRAKVRVLAVEIWSSDQIDDGGYIY